MISSETFPAFSSKKLERTLLFVMALIVVAKIIIKLSLPGSSAEEAWYADAPASSTVQQAGN